MENKYTPEDILLLKRMIDEAGLRGPFSAWKDPNSNEYLEYLKGKREYEEPDNPLMVMHSLTYDKKFSVDVHKEPEYYLKFIIITSLEIAMGNIGTGSINLKFEDCIDWRDYLDGYHFVFYVKKEDVPLYINRKGLNVFVKWRLKIGK